MAEQGESALDSQTYEDGETKWESGERCHLVENGQLSMEVVGDAEHEEVGSVVGGDVIATKRELSEIVFVFNEGRDLGGEKIFYSRQNVEAWSKRGFRPEIATGDIADVEADTQAGIGFHLVLIPRDSHQRIE